MNSVNDLLVSVDVGCREHSVAIGLRDGSLLDEFTISHDKVGFGRFFSGIETLKQKANGDVRVGA